MATHVIIGGDICPTDSNRPLFETGDAPRLFGDLLGELQSADLAVANLECPLIEQKSPIKKTGPVLEAGRVCVNGLVNSHIRNLGLANNHILDHGSQGVESTLKICADAGIQTFGAGRNLEEAGKILVVKAGAIRFGLLGVAEQEWSIATAESAGANSLEPMHCVRTIQRYRRDYDFLIVLLHGGTEYHPFPSPRLMDTCRFLVEQGARVVVCQHSHCAGCYETYQEGHIIYGQGNFLFDSPGRNQAWHEGFLVSVNINPDLSCEWRPIPYLQSQGRPGARRMPSTSEQFFLKGLMERSLAIKDKSFVQQAWEQLCQERQHSYLSVLLGYGQLLSRLNRKGRVVRLLCGEEALRGIKNVVGCEGHREVLLTVLEKYLKGA